MYFLQSEQENVHVYVFELEMWQSSNIVSGLLRSLGLLVGDVCVCVYPGWHNHDLLLVYLCVHFGGFLWKHLLEGPSMWK